MALIRVNNYVEDDPRQSTRIENAASQMEWAVSISPFVSINTGTNAWVVAFDSWFSLRTPRRMFGIFETNEIVLQAAIDVGGNYKADTRYHLFLVDDGANGRLVVSENSTSPIGADARDVVWVATTYTLSGGTLDPLRLYDSQMRKADDANYPVGTLYHALPMLPSPEERFPMDTWVDITDLQGNGIFAVGSGVGIMPESLPNIDGRLTGLTWANQTNGGAFSVQGNDPNYSFQPVGGTNISHRIHSFDASRSSPAYETGAKVLPEHQQYRLYQKTDGQDYGTATVYVIDKAGQLQFSLDMPKDKHGNAVGYNPNTCTLVAPSGTRALRGGMATLFDRASQKWIDVHNNVGKVAYKADGSSRTIFTLGDGLQADESWDAPTSEPLASYGQD